METKHSIWAILTVFACLLVGTRDLKSNLVQKTYFSAILAKDAAFVPVRASDSTKNRPQKPVHPVRLDALIAENDALKAMQKHADYIKYSQKRA